MSDSGAFKLDDFFVLNQLYNDRTFALCQVRQKNSGEQFYLETIFPDQPVSDVFISQFLDRMELLSLFEHPNLLGILHYGQDNGTCFILFESVPGKFFFKTPPQDLKEKDAAAIAHDISSGLAFLHEQEIIHGNLSSENILMGTDGVIKTFNFGFSDLLISEIDELAHERTVGLSLGTPGFVAPEQVKGSIPTKLSDIYAIGAVFFLLLTKEPPFTGITLKDSLLKSITSNNIWPVTGKNQVSSSSVRLIQKCMAQKPGSRFKNMSQVESLLQKIARGKRPIIWASRSIMNGAPKKPVTKWLFAPLFLIAALAGFLLFFPEMGLNRILGIQTPTSEIPLPTREVAALQITITPETVNTQVTSPVESSQGATEIPTQTPTEEPKLEPAYRPGLLNTPIPTNLQEIGTKNISHLKEINRLGMGKPYQAAWAPDNQTSAVATSAGVTLYRDAAMIQFIDPGDAATSVGFSMDGETLVIGLNKGDIQFWDWKIPAMIRTLKGHTARISRIIFSNNMKHLITASYDQNIKIWDLATGGEVMSIKAHPSPITGISLSSDGRLLVSCASDNVVRVWDFSTYEKINEFRDASNIRAVAISPDGTYVAWGGKDGLITQYDIQKRQLRGERIPTQREIWDLYYSPDGNKIFAGYDNAEFGQFSSIPEKKYDWVTRGKIVDNSNKQLILKDIYGSNFEFTSSLALSNQMKSSVLLNWNGFIQVNNTNVSGIKYDDFNKIQFSSQSDYLLIGGKNNYSVLIKISDNRIHFISEELFVPSGKLYSPIINEIALVSRKYGESKFGRPPTYKDYLYTVAFGGSGDITPKLYGEIPINSSVQYVNNGTLLVTSTTNNKKVWDISTTRETFHLSGPEVGCQVIRSQNDRTILSIESVSGFVNNWDKITEKLCRKSSIMSGSLSTFSSDRKWFAYINQNGLLEVQNLEDDLTGISTPLKLKLSSMTFSVNGSILLLGYEDGSFEFWSTETGKQIYSMPGHFGPVRSVTFSPDGKMLASSSFDGTVRIWGIPQNESDN